MAERSVEIAQAIASLEACVRHGVDVSNSATDATELLAAVERLGRLSEVVTSDAIAAVNCAGAHVDHGHVDGTVMFGHVAGASSSRLARVRKTQRMLERCGLLHVAWRTGDLSVEKAAVLGRAFANRRCRVAFMTDDAQRWFLAKAKLSFKRFERKVARWVDLHDQDGPEPAPDPSHERRDVSLVQDHFSKAWQLRASFGSLAGSVLKQALDAYVEAEFLADWTSAEAAHGVGNVSTQTLARTDAQRRADALGQIVADAVANPRASAAAPTTHNIVWSAETFEEMLRRFCGERARPIDPDLYRCETIDGLPLDVTGAFADLVTSRWRRVVVDAAGVVVDLSAEQRFYTGLARLGVQLSASGCYWPGCHLPTLRCQIDHLKPASRGGRSTQRNGLPACQRHNRLKERGYTVTRDSSTGEITISTPLGDTLTATVE